MNILTRIATAAKVSRRLLTLPAAHLAEHTLHGSAINLLSGEWEGGETSRYRYRRATRLVSGDTDLNDGTREAMMSEARRLCQTFPVAGAILERFADYCVHPTGKVKFATTDHEWNDKAEDYWLHWTRQCDAQSIHTFPQMMRVAIKSMKRDGDVFIHKEMQNGIPKLRAVEGDRITNARGGSTGYDAPQPSNQRRDVGGIIVDALGRKVSFTVCDRSGFGGFINPVSVGAAEMLHYLSPSRFETYRGVTAFHAVLNDFRDLKETHDAEKLASKIGSMQTLLERNATGSPRGIDAFGDGGTDNAGNTRNLEDLAPGMMRYLATGESLEMFKSERPAEGWRWFMVYLLRGAAVGLHLPFEFVWDLSGLGGVTVRLMSKQAHRTFTAEMDNLESRVTEPIIAWVIADAMQSGRLPFNPEWMVFKPARPAHPTVDVGRESAANLNELNAGVRTEESICEEQQEDGYDVRVKRAGEVKHRLELARQIVRENPEIPFQQALALMGGANIGPTYGMQQQPPASSPQPAKEE